MDYYAIAIAAARRFIGRPDHDDLIQEAAIRIWSVSTSGRLDLGRPERECRAYLRRAGRSAILDYVARARRQPPIVDAEPCPISISTPEGEAIAKERGLRILAAITTGEARLSPREREEVHARLGLRERSESLAAAHKGTRLVYAHAARAKMVSAFEEVGEPIDREQVVALLSPR